MSHATHVHGDSMVVGAHVHVSLFRMEIRWHGGSSFHSAADRTAADTHLWTPISTITTPATVCCCSLIDDQLLQLLQSATPNYMAACTNDHRLLPDRTSIRPSAHHCCWTALLQHWSYIRVCQWWSTELNCDRSFSEDMFFCTALYIVHVNYDIYYHC